MPKTKALVLFSGGLDSLLAVKLLRKQQIETTGLCFYSSFYNCKKAKEGARALAMELKTVDIGAEMLKLVKNPISGYGKHLNPCLDCHALMIRLAAEIARQEKFDFVATGEVLGQRPFSQNKEALIRVQRLAQAEVLRPLSAKLLDETKIEKTGLVKRGLLERISGRDRRIQIALAEKFNLENYPSPAGGCLLTDPGYSARLGLMLEYWPDCDCNDAEILKYGRVFWINADFPKSEKNMKILIIVGRNQADNESLQKFARKGDFMVKLKDINGPVTLIRTKSEKSIVKAMEFAVNIPKTLTLSALELAEPKKSEEIFEIAALLTGAYAVKARGKKAVLAILQAC